MSLRLKRALSRIGFGPSKKQQDDEQARIVARDITMDSLYEIMLRVYRHPDIYLDDELVRSLHIIPQDLQLDDDGRYPPSDESYYFAPLSSTGLRDRPFDPNDEYAQTRLRYMQSAFQEIETEPTRCKPSAKVLDGYLRWIVGCRRTSPDGESGNLMRLKNWKTT